MEPVSKKRVSVYVAVALLLAVGIFAAQKNQKADQNQAANQNSNQQQTTNSNSNTPVVPNTTIDTPNQPAATDISVNQSVQGSNFNQPDPYKIQAGNTALDLLKVTHQVQTKEYSGIGEFVTSIDGIKPDSKRFWAFYVNGKSSSVGASSYILENGDKIEWKLDSINN